jgi:hypothetical protein
MSATKTVIKQGAWNIQAGILYVPIPEEGVWIKNGEGFYLEFPVGPNSGITIVASVTFEELMLS